MKIQAQTILSDKANGVYGNCLITTYACYLDLDVSLCPQIQLLFDCKAPAFFWDDVLTLWLKGRGYDREAYLPEYDPFATDDVTDYYFAWGMSPRGISHQVIYKEGKLFHDPHPSKAGLVEVKGFEVLRKI